MGRRVVTACLGRGWRAQAAHRDTSGQEPSQKETLTAAWVTQPRCRRTVMSAWTWQVSAQRKGNRGRSPRTHITSRSGWGSSGIGQLQEESVGRAEGAERQEGEPRLTRLHTRVAAANFIEDARGGEGEEAGLEWAGSVVVGWGWRGRGSVVGGRDLLGMNSGNGWVWAGLEWAGLLGGWMGPLVMDSGWVGVGCDVDGASVPGGQHG